MFMGTYMHTGLIHEFSVAKSNNKRSLSSEAFKKEVAKTVVGNPEAYSCDEEGGIYTWQLRPDVKQAHLLTIIKRYYGDFYGSESSYFTKNCEPVISFLSSNPSDEEITK